MAEGFGGKELEVEYSKDSPKDNYMVEEGNKGVVLWGHIAKRVERLRETIGGVGIGIPSRD